MRVKILGGAGMLGTMLVDWLSRDRRLKTTVTYRHPEHATRLQRLYPDISVEAMDAETTMPLLAGCDWVINAVGIIKPYIRPGQMGDTLRAVSVNTLFPLKLAEQAERFGCRVIQIATDCVYSGRDGRYDELARHDATDVYGKSKSLGEALSTNVSILRCSIVGPEIRSHLSLLSWFLGQPQGGVVDGFQNHLWNGITTLHFAKLCGALIHGAMTQTLGLQHVVPADDVSKAELLRLFALSYQRPDLTIRDAEASEPIDRRLRTCHKEINDQMWRAAGYDTSPSISQMIAELADYKLAHDRRLVVAQ